jgi:hypothetical protein
MVSRILFLFARDIKKNMAKRKKKIMQGYTAMAKDFIGWRLHNFAREKEKKWQN